MEKGKCIEAGSVEAPVWVAVWSRYEGGKQVGGGILYNRAYVALDAARRAVSAAVKDDVAIAANYDQTLVKSSDGDTTLLQAEGELIKYQVCRLRLT